jgi:hypothetical protein
MRNKIKTHEESMRDFYRSKTAYLISRGDLVRPDFCHHCGKYGKIHAHHTIYAKPLLIEWLCQSCHAKVHNFAQYGSEHGKI